MDRLRAYGWQLAFLGASVAALVLTLALCFANGDRKALRTDVAAVSERLGQCSSERSSLRSSLNDQNAAVEGLKRASEEKAKAAAKALSEARVRSRALETRIARLSSAQSGPDQCQSARTLIVETLGADRE